MQQANPKQWTYSFANAELLAELSVIQVEFDQDEKVREVFWLDADSAQDRFEFIRIDCSANHHRQKAPIAMPQVPLELLRDLAS